jgi:hypothetical protein
MEASHSSSRVFRFLRAYYPYILLSWLVVMGIGAWRTGPFFANGLQVRARVGRFSIEEHSFGHGLF